MDIFSGTIFALGPIRFLCITWKCNISGFSGNGYRPYLFLYRGCTSATQRWTKIIENTKVFVSNFLASPDSLSSI